jgi:hypothetical protein
MAMGGMAVAGMLILIALVWLSDFPGPPHGDVSKSEAPPEDVKPRATLKLCQCEA